MNLLPVLYLNLNIIHSLVKERNKSVEIMGIIEETYLYDI